MWGCRKKANEDEQVGLHISSQFSDEFAAKTWRKHTRWKSARLAFPRSSLLTSLKKPGKRQRPLCVVTRSNNLSSQTLTKVSAQLTRFSGSAARQFSRSRKVVGRTRTTFDWMGLRTWECKTVNSQHATVGRSELWESCQLKSCVGHKRRKDQRAATVLLVVWFSCVSPSSRLSSLRNHHNFLLDHFSSYN